VPFLSGLLIGLAGFWLRLGVAESPSFVKLRKTGNLASNPVAEAVRNDRSAIATTLGLTAFMAVGFYLPFVWLPTWLTQIIRFPLPADQALIATTFALFALLILTPLTALVSDRIGRKPMFLAGALGYALLSYPVFVLMTSGTFRSALLGGLVFAACCSLFAGCMAATMVELFPTRTRYTGVAIGYNVGQTLLGGTAPLVGTALIHFFGNELAPAFYLIGSAMVGSLACLFIKARHGQPLDETT
jgi:MHS family proline/betaine transporter-like MFS transporter